MIGKQLTENTWLFTSDLGNHVSLVFKRENYYISSHDTSKVFSNLSEIAEEFSEKLIEKSIQDEKEKIDVFGFPVRHSEIFDARNDDNRPTYKTKEDSDIRYVAGHWVLYAEGKYRTAFCPKESTINENCLGPYRDKFSANITLSNKKKTNE